MFLLCSLLITASGVSGISLRGFSMGSTGQTDADMEAFANFCMGPMSDAALGCACARIGRQCKDPLSICDLTHHCKCDGSKGYLAASGTVCLPYLTTPRTTTPTTPTTTACPACPDVICPTTTCPAVTCPTTTTATTTTTTPTTTTPAPAQTCTRAAGFVQYSVNREGDEFTVLSTTPCPSSCEIITDAAKTFPCPNVAYPTTLPVGGVNYNLRLRAFACPTSLIAPAGKTLKVTVNAINVPSYQIQVSKCNDNAIIIDESPGYCDDNPPAGPISISSNTATIMFQLTDEGEGNRGQATYTCQITATAV